MDALRRGLLWWHTARYLRPSQVVGRLRLRTQAAWRRRLPALAQRRYERSAKRLALPPSRQRWTNARIHVSKYASAEDLRDATSRADRAEMGVFQFLNVLLTSGRPIDWHSSGQSQLWRYQLQYGGYLVDLAATRADGWPSVESLMREWIQANPLGHVTDAWHPFVVSERLVNWIFAILMSAPPNSGIADEVLLSLTIQSVFVEANLETDVGGNHLLKNFKAMAVAGYFWNGQQAARWRAEYVGRFGRELNAQLLADGAHYERSPMYHALVLQDALELACVIRAYGDAVPETLVCSILAMVQYLPRMTHPDGDIALFNDSVLREAPRPAALHAFAARVLDDCGETRDMTTRQAALSGNLPGPCTSSSAACPSPHATDDGGLLTIRTLEEDGFVVVDVGPACPDDLPAHAHADLFSFELSLQGRRFFVDSGVGEYRAGPWREYYRSTRAHNTLAVDGQDQIECWGSFRVARRARIFDREVIHGPFVRGVTALHDGYARLSSPVDVRRTFVEFAGRAWLVVDRLEGSGTHCWDSFLHAAPEIRLDLLDDAHAYFTTGDQRVTIAWFGVQRAVGIEGADEPRQGWYAPEFGKHLAVNALVLTGAGPIPTECGYLIVPNMPASEVFVTQTTDGLDIRLGLERYLTTHTRGRISVRLMN